MAKERINATIEREVIQQAKKLVNGKYRNLSHFVEEAMKLALSAEKESDRDATEESNLPRK